jgi:hypothetical protein
MVVVEEEVMTETVTVMVICGMKRCDETGMGCVYQR